MANSDRFKVVSTQRLGINNVISILQDTETGVNYLYNQCGYSGGLTPLVNRDGTPIVTSTYEEPTK
ncbi:MAG: xylan 1,4-beta-xylosidase [Oscillospiraceae bacterium]|nr:xylan 1,4-beta-xylosidase [Oscillospiraceae bacterium]MBR5261712.1 xylan 1,4-beta-xylosidase [Oscillospiraceae bacterium]